MAFQFAGFINDHGFIAGGYADAAGTLHGYLLIKGQFTTVDFPGAGPGGSYIAGVNDSGTIVGFYLDSAGIGHGYEATPPGKSAAARAASASSLASPTLAGLSTRLPSGFAATAALQFDAASRATRRNMRPSIVICKDMCDAITSGM